MNDRQNGDVARMCQEVHYVGEASYLRKLDGRSRDGKRPWMISDFLQSLVHAPPKSRSQLRRDFLVVFECFAKIIREA